MKKCKIIALLMVCVILSSSMLTSCDSWFDIPGGSGGLKEEDDDSNMEPDGDYLSGLGIGYAYNLVENDIYNAENISSNSVLDIDKLIELGRYKKTNINRTEIEAYSYSSNADKYSQAKVHIGFGAGINYGVGSVNAAVSSDLAGAIATHKYNYTYVVNGEVRLQMYVIGDIESDEVLKQCLSAAFLKDVTAVKEGRASVEQLYNKYGSHAVVGVVTGGSYTAKYVVSTNSIEVSKEASVAFGLSTGNKIGRIAELNMQFDASQNEQDKEKLEGTQTNLSMYYSGSRNAVTLDVDEFSDSIKAYESGVAENAIPLSLSNNGTIPLADLIRAIGEEYTVIASDFEDYITKQMISTFIEEMKSQKDEYYRFEGLFTQKEGGERVVDENGKILVDLENINVSTLYPHWTRVKIDVVLNADGGKIGTNVKTLSIGSDYGDLSIPTQNGYAFVGWYTGVDGTGKKISDHNGKTNGLKAGNEDVTLYAYWIPISSRVTALKQIELGSQQTHSEKSSAFNIGLNLEELKNIGYTKLVISISGACSGYDSRMNDHPRYFALYDAVTGAYLVDWTFKVQGFSGVSDKTILINSLDSAGLCQLQLISDGSKYNEKLVVSNLVITVTAVK